jgi:hypothetical protein
MAVMNERVCFDFEVNTVEKMLVHFFAAFAHRIELLGQLLVPDHPIDL